MAVSDEKIIAALLEHGSMKEAAAAVGITPRTIYDHMENREFRAQYMAAKTDIIRKAVFSINEKLSEAIDTVASIMNDTKNTPAVRLQAAQVIINNAGKFSERLSQNERESRSEAKGPWDLDFD